MKFLSTGLTRTGCSEFSTGECAMKMKLSRHALIALLCCLLVQFTAQAGSYGPGGQSNEQSPTQTVLQSPQELQQLVAPIALYPDALVARSEEHTSELQSHLNLVCRLLLDTATTEIYTLSLHDALPISPTQTVLQSPQELQQLVAPIALYPDALVAQVLAASTYPTEIVEADRWLQNHSELK